MTKLRNSVGERIRAIRKAKGLTQQQLAELSGLDDAYIGSLERGERNFSIDTLEKVLLALNISIKGLMTSQDDGSEQRFNRELAVDEFIVISSELSPEQLQILIRINKQLLNAFQTK
nr:helix-turn-helix transcriptional regulator [Paenibacillus xylanexedens]